MPSEQQCPFCQLAANPDQTFDVHETEHFKAWLDINPRARGHTMIVPKDHETSLSELSDLQEFFDIVRIVMEKARNGLDADGVSVVLNDGEAAGQRLEHFYAQVFPRFAGEENEGAPAGAVFQPMEDIEESDLRSISEAMEDASYSSTTPDMTGAATEIVKQQRGETPEEESAEESADDEDGRDPWNDTTAEFT